VVYVKKTIYFNKPMENVRALPFVHKPAKDMSFEEQQVAILSHPLLPYVLRAINDINGGK